VSETESESVRADILLDVSGADNELTESVAGCMLLVSERVSE